MKSIFAHRYFSIIVIVLQCLIWLVVKNDPFFGDAIASTSKAANYIYDNNLRTIFYPQDADPGHPTFYAYTLAALWKLFGRSLWVSHLYSCFWAVLLALSFRRIATLLLPPEHANITTVLVLVFPTYLSQSAMMLNTLALMTFFLVAVYAVFVNNKWLLLCASILMCITHLQSVFLLLSLACFDVYRNTSLLKTLPFLIWFKNRFVIYTIPALVFAGWLGLHYQHTGWLLVSPQYADVEELNTVSEYLKAILLIGWRLVDYGMLPFYLVLIMVWFKQKEQRTEIGQWFVLILPCCLAMSVFLSNTIGHRYFMAFAMLMILAAVTAIQYMRPMGKLMLYIALGLSLLAGNFLYYPGKILGDATLAYRNYFSIEQQLQQEYPGTVFYSHAPLANASRFRYLDTTGLQIERINETPFDSLPAILQSNVNAEFTQSEIDSLTTNWYGKSYENGPVYVTVFFNPKFYPNVTERDFRQPSAFEEWLVGLKKRVKN